jgi:23S rRNA pseudouridine1911/1915/1917 synthase
MRLDRFLADALPALSRTRMQALIAEGRVACAGATVSNASRRVKSGERYRVEEPAPVPARPQGQAIALDVVYEDDDVIVVDKPAGLVVHPAPGNPDRTLVNALIAHCGASLSGIGGEARPGIVHRLDKDTSGLIVAAKNDTAHQGLARQFADHSLDRAYQAVVWGSPSPRTGTLAGNIGRNPQNRKKMAVLRSGGRTAETRYRVLRAIGTYASLLECRLATGRTHQIRVHLAAAGHPVVGDPLYGGGDARRLRRADEKFRMKVAALGRQALHAVLIGFAHPRTGERLVFESPLPREIAELL